MIYYQKYRQKYYQEHREHILETQKRYYLIVRDKKLEYNRMRYVSNPRPLQTCQCGFSGTKKDVKAHKIEKHSY